MKSGTNGTVRRSASGLSSSDGGTALPCFWMSSTWKLTSAMNSAGSSITWSTKKRCTVAGFTSSPPRTIIVMMCFMPGISSGIDRPTLVALTDSSSIGIR